MVISILYELSHNMLANIAITIHIHTGMHTCIYEASILWTTLVFSPISPDVEKTRGEKQPCSFLSLIAHMPISFLAQFFSSTSPGGGYGKGIENLNI